MIRQMSAEGPDKTVNGERTLWKLTHSRQWTTANTRELENIAEEWIREHEENARIDSTPGTRWQLKRAQRIAFLGETIKATFRDEAQFRVGTVNRRIQEVVNRLTSEWVVEDANAETRRRKPRAPSPRTALADARRLTEAPSGVPAGMQHIVIPNTGSLARTDTHRPRSLINLEEPDGPELDLTGGDHLPPLETGSPTDSLLTHSPTVSLTGTEGSLSPSESRAATGQIWDDPRYANVTMPTIDLVLPAPIRPSGTVPSQTSLPPSPPPVQRPRGRPAPPPLERSSTSPLSRTPERTPPPPPPRGRPRRIPPPPAIVLPGPPPGPPGPPPAPGAPIAGPVVGNIAPVPVRPDDRGIGSYNARYVIERPETYSETVPMVPLGPTTPIVPRNARLQIPNRFRAPRSQTVNVLNNRVFSTKWGPLENSFATEALRNGSIELRGNTATISCSKAGKVAKGDIHSITKFIKKRFRLGGVLNGSKMSSQQITHNIIANLPGTFQVSR